MITCPGCGSVNDETKSIYCENCGLQITGSPPAQKSSAFLLQNRYEVLNIIKSGAMGAVYKALDTRLNSVVAVKKMFNKGSDPAEILKMEEMFRREAEILVSLDYPGLPRVIDYFIDSDENGVNSNFLVMTFIDGYDLETYLVKNPAPLPYKKAMGIFNGILDILDYLHSLNPPVVYRDLKPSNVMIRDGKVCLVDFGIAKAIEPGRKGTMMGTAGYASPDQIKGFDTPANDVYSLGVLMHYLFTGKNPEDENRPMFIFEPVRDLNRKVPEHISSLVESMVNIVSSQRPQSAEAVIEILKNEMYFYDDEDTPEEDDSALPSLSISFKVLDNNLLVAAEKGDYETVKECVRKGADVNTQTASGATPLFIAAKKGYRNIVSYLLLMHANFKIADSKGLTPLHIAANNGHKEIAHILAESGADINWKSQDGNTPLDLAVMRGRWDIFRAMKNIGEYAPAPQKNTDTDSNAELEKKVKSMVLLVMGVIALIASGSIISSMADYGILKEEKP
ncbi:MAG: ankyrin repeat domain-containing protein [Firmicutes bacterium]|nr:ankyrin repeat domain-containing protein [Bacillota bacterium]